MIIDSPASNIHLVYSYLYGIVNAHYALCNILPIILFVAWMTARMTGHIITNVEQMNIIYGKIKNDWCREYDDEMRPCGYVLHRPTSGILPRYIVYKPFWDRSMVVYSTRWYMDNVLLERNSKTVRSSLPLKPQANANTSANETTTESADDGSCGANSRLRYMYRTGDYNYIRYKHRKMQMPAHEFKPMQLHIFEQTMKFYNEHNYATIFIEGPFGVGKTWGVYLIANEVGAIIVDTFNPTEPSDSIDNLYTIAQHTAERPLIVLMDEVDTTLLKISREVPPHKNHITHVRNKVGWNNFLDKIQIGCFPNLILAMCSNKTREQIAEECGTADAPEYSYLRDGRVNLHFRIGGLPPPSRGAFGAPRPPGENPPV
jgi:hypothetical protein